MIPQWALRPLSIPLDNPEFPADEREIAADWERMRSDPRPLQRPVLILAGWRAWSVMPRTIATALQHLTGQPSSMFLPISYPWSGSFPSACAAAHREIARRFGHSIPDLDCVGASMGGLVARALAAGQHGQPPPPQAPPPLPIRRLFTLGTPHRGARLATIVALDSAARQMRPGSEFLTSLDAALLQPGAPDLVCYARLRDHFVGATRTAPPGHEPRWVSGYLLGSHLTLTQDRRILADIARRLRGEPPLAVRGSPPPGD